MNYEDIVNKVEFTNKLAIFGISIERYKNSCLQNTNYRLTTEPYSQNEHISNTNSNEESFSI